MNESTTHEQLSALMDGELPRDELRFLLRRLDSDASLAQRWSRYQVISAVFKQQSAMVAGDKFAAAVLARLDADAPSARQPLAGRLLRWAGGGAIAASVAIVALLATRPATDGTARPAGDNAIAAVTAPASAPQPLVGELRQPLPQQLLPAGFADYAQPAAFESIVPNYAPRYAGGSSANGTEGFVPYVLIVGSRQQALEPQPPAKPEAAPAH